MTFLPIVDRELRESARQPVTHRLRWVIAGAVILIWCFLTLFSGSTPSPQRAKAVFVAISMASLGFAMLAGVFLTADSLSEERREGTLGLLFLTDLKGHDVILGKLVSTSIRAFYGLLAILPVLALPLLMGGMTFGEFYRMVILLVATIFFSLASGMLVSAISQDTRAAMLGTLAVMIFFAGLLPTFWSLLEIAELRVNPDFMLWPSPAYAFRNVFANPRSQIVTGLGEYWISIVTLLVLGIGCLVCASVILPRVWREAGNAKRTESQRTFIQRLRFGTSEERLRHRLQCADPLFWLTTRDRLPRLWSIGCLGPLGLIWICFFCALLLGPRSSADECFSVCVFLGYGMHQVFKCIVATEASRRLCEDRRSGALELLLSSPVTPRQIIEAQQAAVGRCFEREQLCLALMNLAMVWMLLFPNPLGFGGDPLAIFVIVYLASMLLLYLDCSALTRVGLGMGLRANGHPRAILATLRRVMLPPWLAILLFVFMAIAHIGFSQESVYVMIVVWLLAGMVLSWIVAAELPNTLERQFRELASGSEAKRGDAGASESPWELAKA